MKIQEWLSLLNILQRYSLAEARPPHDQCIIEETRLICKKQLPNITYPSNITTLELGEIKWPELDFTELIQKFPNLENLTIIGHHLHELYPPEIETKLKVLQLKNLHIAKVTRKFISHFPRVEVLNLEGNSLQSLSKEFVGEHLKELYLLENRWNCSRDLEWVLRLSSKVVTNLSDLTCYDEPHAGKPLVSIAQFLKDIKTGCPSKCNCTLPKVVREPRSGQLEPIIEVNCSERGLTRLPKKFPTRTKILHLEGNEIEDLSPLKDNPIYRSVLDLYLDNNQVDSIEELEGSYWLQHFRVFSLRGNKLTEIPSYALDNALLHNSNMPNAVRITFGGNPWRCDCVFTPVFQEMLQKYAPQIKDLREVKCSYVEGDENSLLPIMSISRSSVCRFPTEYSVQEALDLLNAVLGFLIVFVLGKLAYDYYHFKKTGRLPWIVTKMP